MESNTVKEPQIGVYLCRCLGEIEARVDLKAVMDFARQLPNVSVVKIRDALCTASGQQFLKGEIESGEIDRVVVAGCSPRAYERVIGAALKGSRLNIYLYEQVNIREHCAWVHDDRGRATAKAQALVAMSVAKATYLEPLTEPRAEVKFKSALVIGGGVAGMQAALDIASRGFRVYLVEREPKLGGRTYQLAATFPTLSCGICCLHNCKECILTPKIDAVYLDPNIEVIVNSEVSEVTGHIGNYEAKIRDKAGDIKVLKVGAIVTATGSETFDARKIPEYGYGLYEDVITSVELGKIKFSELRRPSNGEVPRTVNFVLCVGSRGEEKGNPYCSLVCCTFALGMAIEIKRTYPNTQVYIHYIDLRAPYRGFEEAYSEARRLGVNFLRGRVAEVEKVDGNLVLTAKDVDLGRLVRMNTDLVVLCVGQEPSEATEKLSKMLYKDLDVDGFFKEINLEYATIEEKGVFIAGCAQGPRGIRYSVADGKIAAANAIAILEKANVELYPIRAHVVEERCDGCGFCIDPCPYKAITVVEYVDKGAEKKIVRLNEATCRGCGICVATCPKRGILVRHFTSEQLSAMIDAALAAPRDGEEPLILAFACDWCGYPASDMAGVARIVYPDNVRIIRVMCSGMVHPDLIMTALTKGADGVLVLGCHPGECYYIDGNLKAEKRGEAIRLMLEDFGLNPRRYRSEWLAGSEPEKFIQAVNSMMEELREERK